MYMAANYTSGSVISRLIYLFAAMSIHLPLINLSSITHDLRDRHPHLGYNLF